MNWVGGARSRVKYFNNNRVQRDYFECKRLAAKVQRLQPSRKKNGSLDLYFFNKTLTGELKPGSTIERVKSAKLTKLEARQDIPCVRELELSMSPIGQPSMLDVTDVSAVDQELSLYGPEPVKDQPRMSTQKLPHLIKRENSGDHTKFDTKNSTADESLLSFGMDLSTMSESFLPPPTKKLKPGTSAPPKFTDPYSKYKSNTSAPKKFSFNEDRSLVPALFKPPTIATESHKSTHQLAYEESKRKKGDSKAAAFHETERGMPRKHQVPQQQHHIAGHNGAQKRKSVVAYDRDAMLEFHYEEQGHSSKDERKCKNKHQIVSGHETAGKHFKIDFGGVESTGAAIPSLSEQSSLPVASASDATQSVWSNGTIHSSSVSSIGMSENPFPRRPNVETTKDKEVSSHTDLDKSILRPIAGRAKHKVMASQHPKLSESIPKPTCIRGPKIQQKDLEISPGQYNTTLFDESIFGPIQKKKDKAGLDAGALPPLKAYQQTISKKSSKSSAFELMMKSFEHDEQSSRERDVDCNKGKDRKGEKEQTGRERNNKPAVFKNTEWKNFINGVNTKPVHVDQTRLDKYSAESKSHSEQEGQGYTDCERKQNKSMSSSSTLLTNPKIPFHNISALEELICLEEENAANLISQDFPLSPADWTEDPILVQTQKSQSRACRPASGFDSSQDSTEAIKGSSCNDSNSNSMSRCNSSLSSEATHQPPFSVEEQEEEQPCTPIKDTPTKNVHCTSNDEEEIKGKHNQLAATADVRSPIQSSGADENKSTQVCIIDDKQAHSQTRLNISGVVSETNQESVKANWSTQWSLITSVKDSTSTETQSASQHNMEIPTEETRNQQTETMSAQKHLSLLQNHLSKPHTVTESSTQTGQGTQTIDKLRKEIARLERELGAVQSTLVWQSLMMRLQQIETS